MNNDFLSLYDQYFDDVYRYTLFKTGNKWDADDLSSEIFRKAFEKHRSLRSNLRAWLMTIARNTVIDFYRKKKDLPLAEGERQPDPYSFEEILGREDELFCLKQALKALPGEDLEIINLKYFSDLTHKEIGQVLGKTGDAVKMKSLCIVSRGKNSCRVPSPGSLPDFLPRLPRGGRRLDLYDPGAAGSGQGAARLCGIAAL